MNAIVALSDEEPHGLQAVCGLSDDEASAVVPVAQSRPPIRKRSSTEQQRCLTAASDRLHDLVRRSCACKGDCRVPFRQPQPFEDLLKERMRLHNMSKPDADDEANACSTIPSWEWLTLHFNSACSPNLTDSDSSVKLLV